MAIASDGYLPTAIMDRTMEYDEYRCSACKKAIRSQVVRCKVCPKLFYHPGCVCKHRVYDKNKELVPCNGPFEKFMAEDGAGVNTPQAAGVSRDRLGSAGSISGSRSASSSVGMELKIDWLVRTVKEMKNEVACKNEVKTIIAEIIREEMDSVKKEIENIKTMIKGTDTCLARETKGSYSGAVKERKKEKVIIIKPNVEQESEATKKTIKEKVDIKNMSVGVSRLKKGSHGTVILGCETREEIEKLKSVVQEKMGENFKVTESAEVHPKIKIVNVEEEELKLEDNELVCTIKKQNGIEEIEGRQMKIVKRIIKAANQEKRKRGTEEGSIILEVDEETHKELLNKGKLSVGWKKCPVYNHVNVKRCFKCWGYYHIAKNCTRKETCHKCAGNHKENECTVEKKKCVNCMFKNQAYNLKMNDEHDALDRECPTFKRAMQEEKRRAGWEQ